MRIVKMTNKKTFWELLENKIEIPIIQRDYAQGRGDDKTKRIRENFLDTLIGAIGDENKTINLDFIYGTYIEEEKKIIPLDGQQRLTTLYLLHWYIALKSNSSNKELISRLLNFTYETRVSSREFCENLIKNYTNIGSGEKLSDSIQNQSWFYSSWIKDPTIKSMLTMIDTIDKKFKKYEEVNFEILFNNLKSTDNPPITFDFLELKEFKLTDELYVKMNARGKPLTEFENFKAKLIELMDEDNDIVKIDTIWTDLFWNNKKTTNIDDDFLNFFKIMTINFALVSGALEERNKLESINILDIYEKVYRERSNLQNIITILDNLSKFDKRKNNEIKNYFKDFLQKDTLTAWDRAKMYSYNLFLSHYDEEGFEDTSFDDWIRVTTNIIDNHNIDSVKKLKDILILLMRLANNTNNITEFLSQQEKNNVDSFRNREFQLEEEKLKATLILSNSSWKQAILEAERHWYIKGQIRFLLEFSQENDEYSLENFKNYYHKFDACFPKNSKVLNDYKFQRALLAKGDYLPEYTNANFCSFDDSPRGKDDNWRQVFYEADKKQYLKDLFDDENDLDAIIVTFDDKDDWRYHFIQNVEILKYCKKFKIRCYYSDTDHELDYILLLSGERIYGEHAEYYTYVKYLELKDSVETIEYKYSNSSDEHPYLFYNAKKIEYKNQKWYCDNKKQKDKELLKCFNDTI